MYDEEPEYFNDLELPNLSMLATHEIWTAKREGEDAWSDVDSLDSEFDLMMEDEEDSEASKS